MEQNKSVDESWKDSVESEKVVNEAEPKAEQPAQVDPSASKVDSEEMKNIEVNFISYITSLVFQTMIFLGDVPNPMNENKIDQNLTQAKFLIDTLVLIRDKTKGNLAKEEEDLLNSSVYELQMKYVEYTSKENSKDI